MNIFNSDVAFKGQKYSALKKKALASDQLFRDPEFPPVEQSLFRSPGKGEGIEWKRPKDICEDPHLFVDGVSTQDLIQGELGNCWFVAACACLAINKRIWSRVIPDHKTQEWDPLHPERYAGIFHFRFWRFGHWTDVVVDDFLPTRNGQLVFIHSKSRNEFWSALLEKAYAKLFGSYEDLNGGELAEALEDFTGGVSEVFDFEEEKLFEDGIKKDNFYDWIKKEMSSNSLMAAAIPAKSKDEMETSTESGLVRGHAYAVTAVRRVAVKGTGIFNLFNRERLSMIRLRNPWGGSEWKGSFSDKASRLYADTDKFCQFVLRSAEWSTIPKKDRQRIGLTFDDDGEFWMTFDDFCKHFINMAVCHAVNTSLVSLQKTWHESVLHEEWSIPHHAGGCINNKGTFLNNPQFMFDMTEEEEVMIVLTQKTQRVQGEDRLTVGFTLIKTEENRKFRLHTLQTVVASSVFRNSRGIFLRQRLDKGRYVIIVCTFEPEIKGRFLLRVYTGCQSKAKELELEKPEKSPCNCIALFRYPMCVTQIKILKGIDLKRPDNAKGISPYCVVLCEGEKIRTPIVKDCSSPEWTTSAIFYRKEPFEYPINVEVWHSGLIIDDFLGRQQFLGSTDEISEQILDLPLLQKDSNEPSKCGRLVVSITNSYNLQAL